MIEKKGWLKNAEARLTGFYIRGNRVKSYNMTQEEVDAWNGAEAAVEEVVEEVVETETAEVAPVATAAPKPKSKKKPKMTLKGLAKAAIGK